MKKILLLPLFFAISLILSFLAIGGMVYLYFQVSNYSVVTDHSVLSQQFMFILNVTYIPTLFVAAFVTFIFINKRKIPSLFGVLFVCGLFFVFMLFGYNLLKPGSWQQQTQISGLEEKRILDYEKLSIFIHSSKNHDLDHVIIYDKNSENPPALKYKRFGSIKDNTIYTGSDSYLLYPASQLSVQAYSAPNVLTSLTRDTVYLSDNLNTAKQKSFLFFLFVIASYVLFILVSFLVSRMTRWPLLNYLLTLFGFRLFLYLQSVFYNKTFLRIFQEFGIDTEKTIILLLSTLILCLAMTVCYLIFRVRGKKQDMIDG